MENQPMYSMDHDMRPIYKYLYKKYQSFPEIVIYDRLESNQVIAYTNILKDRRILYVKNDSDEVLLEELCKEIESPSCELSSLPCFYHKLTDNVVAKWCMYACYIADALNIDLKQILFTNSDKVSGYSDFLPTIIFDGITDVEMLANIAHELRHSWQHRHYPEWFTEYIKPEEDEQGYRFQISEIDAEAFGIKVESIITGVEFVNSYAGLEMDPEYRKEIIKRMNEIDVILSSKKIREIRKIIDLDGIFESVN